MHFAMLELARPHFGICAVLNANHNIWFSDLVHTSHAKPVLTAMSTSLDKNVSQLMDHTAFASLHANLFVNHVLEHMLDNT